MPHTYHFWRYNQMHKKDNYHSNLHLRNREDIGSIYHCLGNIGMHSICIGFASWNLNSCLEIDGNLYQMDLTSNLLHKYSIDLIKASRKDNPRDISNIYYLKDSNRSCRKDILCCCMIDSSRLGLHSIHWIRHSREDSCCRVGWLQLTDSLREEVYRIH